MGAQHDRLVSAVRWHYDQLAAERSIWRFFIDHLVGEYYGAQSTERQQPTVIQLLGMALKAYASHIAVRAPQALCVAKPPAWEDWVRDAQISLNNRLSSSGFGRVLREVVDQSMIGVGCLCTSVDYVGTPDDMKLDLVLEAVDLPDLVWDVNAKRIEHSDFVFRKVLMPLTDAREHPMFGDDREKLMASSTSGRRENESSAWREAFGAGVSDLYDYVSLWHGYLRREDRCVIFPEHQAELVLYDERWNGPSEGPFRFLSYEKPVGSAMPVSPAQRLVKTHRAYNTLMTKALWQQQAAKGLLLYTTASRAEAKEIAESVDNQSVLQENGAVRWAHVGGAAPDTVSMSELARKMFSYAAGNLDIIAGLGSQAPTLGQERLMADTASDQLRDMQDAGYQFVKEAVRDIFWFDIRDPYNTEPIKHELPDGDSYEVPWTPEKRELIRQWKMEVDINPYSMRMRTPESRLADLMGAVQTFMMIGEQAIAQGLSLDVQKLMEVIADYRDLPELKKVLITNQDPQELMAASGPREGKPPLSGTRRYERRSTSDGSGEMQEMLRSFGRNQEQEVSAA